MSETDLKLVTIGVDPGFAAGGIGVVSDGRALQAITFRTDASQPDGWRFDDIIDALAIVADEYRGRIRAIACEDITRARQGGYWSGATNDKAEHVRRVVGNVHMLAVMLGVPFYEVLPRDWRSVVGIRGSSDNERDKRAVRSVTGWSAKVFSGHAAAALGIAVAGERLATSGQKCLELGKPAGRRKRAG